MGVYRTDPELFVAGANILKALAHPQRLCIVKTLCEKEQVNVSDMQECLGEVQSTVSQHIARLKAAGVIVGKREGTNIFYSIANEKQRISLQALIKTLFPDS